MENFDFRLESQAHSDLLAQIRHNRKPTVPTDVVLLVGAQQKPVRAHRSGGQRNGGPGGAR